jgi:hypothetical protein
MARRRKPPADKFEAFFAPLAREIRSPLPRDPLRFLAPYRSIAAMIFQGASRGKRGERIAIPIRGNRRAIAGRHRHAGLIADGKPKKVHFSFWK